MPVPTTTCPLNLEPSRLKAAAFSSTTITSCPSESRSFASAEPTRPHPTIRYLMNRERGSEESQLYPGGGRPLRDATRRQERGCASYVVRRGVAQLGRALRSGRRGRTFKSCRPDFPSSVTTLCPRASPRACQGKGVEGLFSKFNPAARRVLRVAEQECRNHSHYYVGAEHLLVGPARRARPCDAARSRRVRHRRSRGARASSPSARHRRRSALGGNPDHAAGPAHRRARRGTRGEREVGPIDLFEALRAEGGSSAAEILRRAAARNTASPVE